MTQIEKTDLLFKEYSSLLNLWNTGMAEYHNLTNIYLTAINILLVAIAFLFRKYLIFETTLFSCQIPINIYPDIFLCILGIFLCIQMAIAQSRLRSQNAYWERCIRIIEKKEHWKSDKFFNVLYNYREKNMTIPEDKLYFEKEFIPSFGIKYHRKCWAPRMKWLPKLYSSIFILLIIINFFHTEQG